MAHRDDHHAALARAAALERDLKRARKEAQRAERRASDAERRAVEAERRAAEAAAQAPRVIDAPPPPPPRVTEPTPRRVVERPLWDLEPPPPSAPTASGDEAHPPDSGNVLLHMLLILAGSLGAVIGAAWLMTRL